MRRKTPLSRYNLGSLPRELLEHGAWLGTHTDYRSKISGVRYVMTSRGLEPLSSLSEKDLVERYLSHARRALQENARAKDLDLFELNPDDPENDILFADTNILFTTRGGWVAAYVQPSNFNPSELDKIRKYAQVVAILNKKAKAADLVALLRDPATFSDWQELERSGAVDRGGDRTVVNFPNPDGTVTQYHD